MSGKEKTNPHLQRGPQPECHKSPSPSPSVLLHGAQCHPTKSQLTTSSARPPSHSTLMCLHCNAAPCVFKAGAGLCKKLTQLFSPTPLLPKSLALKLSLVTWLGQLSAERLLAGSVDHPARGSVSGRQALCLPWTMRKAQQGQEYPRNSCTQAKPSIGKCWLQGPCLFQNALGLALTPRNMSPNSSRLSTGGSSPVHSTWLHQTLPGWTTKGLRWWPGGTNKRDPD